MENNSSCESARDLAGQNDYGIKDEINELLLPNHHAIHLLDRDYFHIQYEATVVGIEEVMARTRFYLETDGHTDGQSETNMPALQLWCAGV